MKVGDTVITRAFTGFPDFVTSMHELVDTPGKVLKVHKDGTLTVKHPQASETWFWPIKSCEKVETPDEPITPEELLLLVKKINKKIATLQKHLSDLETKIHAGIKR